MGELGLSRGQPLYDVVKDPHQFARLAQFINSPSRRYQRIQRSALISFEEYQALQLTGEMLAREKRRLGRLAGQLRWAARMTAFGKFFLGYLPSLLP